MITAILPFGHTPCEMEANMGPSRRQFLEGAIGSGVSLAFLSQLRPVSAAEAKLEPSLVKLDDSLEPTVRLLEQTPRDRVLEEVAARVKKGLSYRELLAALLLAGVRNVQPRPQVGFKFHAVLVINSAHLASLASPDSDRWLPIFWAVDRFKSAQAETQHESGWRMSAVDEGRVPAGSAARSAFVKAMDEWDESAADAAAAGIARSLGRDECFELFVRYGARDFRDIGHKAIFVANSFRTMDAIGWQNAEPVIRSLAYALLQHEGENPAQRDAEPDRPWRQNETLAKKVRGEWLDGKPSRDASSHLLETFRTASSADAAAAVVDALNDNVAPASIWDAILCASGEMLMRRTNILTLHSVTSSNALHFAYSSSDSAQTRLMLMLQNASFVPLFRQAAGEKNLSDARLDKMSAESEDKKKDESHEAGKGAGALDEVFADASHDRSAAAANALAYLDGGGRPEDLIAAARRLVFLKGNDAHDYKFSSAVLEDYYHVSPQWRNRYLATSLFYLPGSGAPDNPLVQRIREAMA